MNSCRFFGNHRFDFGVPLEDVFPHKEIHPRLKFLFESGFETVVNSNLSIEYILSNSQECLDTRLHLKHIIIHEVNYEKEGSCSPGTYLWLIRHFLGLLPIPLIPQYSNEMSFHWKKLSDECLEFLKSYGKFDRESHIFNYIIVDGLSKLPPEHLILLNYLMVFLRKIASRTPNNSVRKRNILIIAKYFCGSIFIRPYRPGHTEKDMLPIFLYLLLKWHEIQSISVQADIINYNSQKINNIFNCKENLLNLNFFNNKYGAENQRHIQKCYIKDSSSQTEIISVSNRSNQTSFQYIENILDNGVVKATSSQTDAVDVVNRSCQTSTQDLTNGLTGNESGNINLNNEYPLANSTAYFSEHTTVSPNNDEVSFFTAPDVSAKYYSIYGNTGSVDDEPKNQDSGDVEVRAKQESELVDETPLSFFSALDKGNNWSNIIGETSKTVKKIDQYIYDDYDTFAKEDFNQLADARTSSLIQEEHSNSKLGWTYNIFKNTCQNNNNSLERDEENFYFPFENVDNILFNNVQSITDSPDTSPTVKSLFNSNEILYHTSKEKSNFYRETKSKLNFGLKRFKIKMNFFRFLTPRNVQRKSVMEGYFSNPKYEKMKVDKANTI